MRSAMRQKSMFTRFILFCFTIGWVEGPKDGFAKPVVVIIGPTRISNCEDLKLYGDASYGNLFSHQFIWTINNNIYSQYCV